MRAFPSSLKPSQVRTFNWTPATSVSGNGRIYLAACLRIGSGVKWSKLATRTHNPNPRQQVPCLHVKSKPLVQLQATNLPTTKVKEYIKKRPANPVKMTTKYDPTPRVVPFLRASCKIVIVYELHTILNTILQSLTLGPARRGLVLSYAHIQEQLAGARSPNRG